MKKHQIRFVVNPFSGNTSKRNLEQAILKYLDFNQFDYQIIYTEYAGHAIELTKTAVLEGADIVVAVGGDGSVNEVAAGLIGTSVKMGILPLGSGNGFAKHLGLSRDLEIAFATINRFQYQSIDAATINGKVFVNLVGFGFDGLISNKMKKSRLRGLIGYAIKTLPLLFAYDTEQFEVKIDDKIPFNLDCFMLDIVNGSRFGYNFKIHAAADLSDGLLHLVAIKKASKWKYPLLLFAMLRGRVHKSKIVSIFSAKRIEIHTKKQIPMHLDGEGMYGSGDFEILVLPNALEVIC
jgi:diacylglycerol kinase (ATP)